MTEPDDDGGDEDGSEGGNVGGSGGEPDAAIIWYILGFIAGLFLTGKVMASQGIDKPESLGETVVMAILLLAPMFLLGASRSI
ncbi:hypothetical protein ACWDRR_33415 [Kitasatospora sp. NPDC003701]